MTVPSGLRERVREAASVAPAERSAAIDALAGDGSDARVLRAIFEPAGDGSLVAREALGRVRREGYGAADARELLAAAVTAPDVQREWARSQEAERREEVLLRLELLARVPDLEPDLVPFLALYLRSPDPLVYQAAALAIGRHLASRPDLRAAVEEYAAGRELALGSPTPLSGNRTQRRVLLVQAAARASAASDGESLPALLRSGDPVGLSDGDALDAAAADPEDATVLLVACRLLLDAPNSVDGAVTAARRLLDDLPAAELGETPPVLLQRWGELLRALAARGAFESAEAAAAWGDVARRLDDALRGPSERSFDALARGLALLDEHARTLAALPTGRDRAIAAVRDDLTPAHRALLEHRAGVWSRESRPDRSGADHRGGAVAVPDAATPALRCLLRERPTATEGVGERGPVDADLDLVAELLAPLGDAPRWESLAAGERALRVVFGLGTLADLDGGHGRALSLLRAADVPVPPGIDARSRALAAVLLRVLRFEGAASARALDSRILESVSDLGVLLTLLPTEASPALAADLADNLEHQVRRSLQMDAEFSPVRLLVLTTVRDPHPAFYRELAEIVAHRTYRDASGRDVPVADALDAIRRELTVAAGGDGCDSDEADADEVRGGRDETADGSEERASETAGERGAVGAWERAGLADDDPVVAARSGARERLDGVTAAGASVWDALDALVRAVGVPTGPRDAPASDTLLGVVELVHPSGDRMLASGPIPWLEAVPAAFVERHAARASSIRARLGAIRPERLDDAGDAHDAVTAVVEDLGDVVDALLPVLPEYETTRLRAAFEAVDARVDTYAQALDAVVARWDPADPPRTPERWDALLGEVSERWTPPDRLPVLQAAFRSLDAAAAAGDGDEWTRRRAFLEWAASADAGREWTTAETETWRESVAGVWVALLEDAMAAGQESRVRDLLEAPVLDGVRGDPTAGEALAAAHEWALDRYMLGLATRVRGIRSGSRDATALGVREVGAFLVHHSTVWTALIVGAILMEDFGGAWQAMAEQGDVQGIGITFVLAVAGAFGYVMLSLHRNTSRLPGEARWPTLRSHLARASSFVAVSWTFTLGVTAFLWWLLSGTDQVVHGPGAVLHVVVWSSFALLAGIFLGLVAKAA